jgi:ABC-type nitrate/sulfonate/bicarbonate transport system permease component
MARRGERAASLGSRAVQIGFLLGILALWYLATNRWGVNRLLLPNPIAVWQQLVDVLKSGEYLPDLRITLTELVAAFALSMSCGTIVGFFVSRTRYTIRVFDPLFAGIYSIPIILFLPLYVLFFGLGPASKIALGATISFFPIAMSTIAGFGNVDAHGIHHRASRHHRQRGSRVAGRPRPSHCSARRRHGYGAHVRLRRLRRSDRRNP